MLKQEGRKRSRSLAKARRKVSRLIYSATLCTPAHRPWLKSNVAGPLMAHTLTGGARRLPSLRRDGPAGYRASPAGLPV